MPPDSLIPAYPTGDQAGNQVTGILKGDVSDLALGEIISRLLPYIYVFAGIALLVMLIAGGLSLMTAAGDEGKVKAGYGKITGALIGFLIVFLSYLIAQLVEVILGVKIL